jgi:hypothetical protein
VFLGIFADWMRGSQPNNSSFRKVLLNIPFRCFLPNGTGADI